MSAAGVGWPIPSSDAFALSMRYLTEWGYLFLSQELLPVWKSC